MSIIKVLKDWRKQDPVRYCKVYRAVGCAHVDGMLCNMKTCDVVVHLALMPNVAKEVDHSERYEDRQHKFEIEDCTRNTNA